MKAPLKFTITDEVYHATIGVAAGMPFVAARKWYFKALAEEYEEEQITPLASGACMRRQHRKNSCLWFPDRNPTISVVAHEVWHGSFHILMRSGLSFGYEAEEAWTHHFDWLFNQVTHGLWPRRKCVRF